MGKGTWYLPITLEILSMPGVLNLWVVALLGVEWSFRRHHLSPSENTDVRITIHNSSRLQLKSRNKIILWSGRWSPQDEELNYMVAALARLRAMDECP